MLGPPTSNLIIFFLLFFDFPPLTLERERDGIFLAFYSGCRYRSMWEKHSLSIGVSEDGIRPRLSSSVWSFQRAREESGTREVSLTGNVDVLPGNSSRVSSPSLVCKSQSTRRRTSFLASDRWCRRKETAIKLIEFTLFDHCPNLNHKGNHPEERKLGDAEEVGNELMSRVLTDVERLMSDFVSLPCSSPEMITDLNHIITNFYCSTGCRLM